MTERLEARLVAVLARRDELRALLAEPAGDFVELSRELAEIEPVAARIEARDAARAALGEARALGEADDDPEMRALALEEAGALEARLAELDSDLRLALAPRDEADRRNAILEVRAAAGGEEAALFASDLVRMYQRWVEAKGWRFRPLAVAESDLGGVREATVEIEGVDAFAHLKFEAGVHRVQRVPATESGGRIHTSTVTVAVLPEAEEVDFSIDEKEVRIDVFRASGAGGQHVNKTESAVRITHLPTGMAVSMQDEKSQHRNREKAMRILRARLFDRERGQADAARAAERKGQVGSGDRSERIRTYNFPQSRVTDHRIELTLYKLAAVLEGDLDEIVEALRAEERARLLAALEE